MTDVDVAGDLVARRSRAGFVPLAVFFAAATAAYVVLGVTGYQPSWLAVVGVVLFGGFLVATVVMAVRAPALAPELRMDAGGVGFRSGARARWDDLAEVRITGMRPRWLFWSSFGFRVVTFVLRPGAPVQGRAGPGWQQRLHRHRYGSHLHVMPYALTVSADDLAAAATRLGGVPVVR